MTADKDGMDGIVLNTTEPNASNVELLSHLHCLLITDYCILNRLALLHAFLHPYVGNILVEIHHEKES